MIKNAIAVLVSGGLDSAVLVAELSTRHRQVQPIYIRQGLAWESVELYWLKRYLKAVAGRSIEPLVILSLPMEDVYGDHWSVHGKSVPGARTADQAVYLPGRNLVLIVKAAIYCSIKGLTQITVGSLGHNPFPDATPGFFNQFGQIIGRALAKPMKIYAPYRDLSKKSVITKGRDLPLHLSFSCISPRGRRHCGRCNKCAERRLAFRRSGVKDLTVYAKN
jgi:7-cyano-7-deazaguanine synthase